MKNRNLAAMLLTLALTFGASQSALAGGRPDNKPPGDSVCDLKLTTAHNHVCRAELNYVLMDIGIATSVRGNLERKLVTKVCQADEKVHMGKDDDAAGKLQDLIDTIIAKSVKLEPNDYLAITESAAIARDCVRPPPTP